MADRSAGSKKPRIRKVAPTVRERVEAAQAKSAEQKPSRVRKSLAKLPKPQKRLHLPSNKAFSLITKVLSKIAPRYFANAWRELRQVTWPNRRETWRLTLAVFVFAIVFGALVAGVDKGLDEIFKKVVLK